MNNNVKKVVFYSTRQIHPYFSDKVHLTQCNSMIRYFSRLKNDEDSEDDLSRWLSDLAFLYEYYQTLEIIKQKLENGGCNDIQNKYNEISPFLILKKEDNPSNCLNKLEDLLGEHKPDEDQKDLFWDTAYNEYIDFSDKKKYFEPSHFEMYKDQVLSGNVTHLNRDFTEIIINGGSPEEINNSSRVKHRLGIYHKEEGEYAVAAVWPWPKGDTLEPNHDDNWKKVIVDAIKELYPNTDEIILVIHDWDLDEWKEKDQIVFRKRLLSRINESDYNDDLPSSDDPCISLIVFQHTNGKVLEPLNKDRGNHLNTPKQVWEAIDKYIESGYLLMKADKGDLITKIHSEAID